MRDLSSTVSISGPDPSQHLSGELTDRISPELASGLYIIATPIGNLRDITLRALDVLGAVDHVLAEDTRVAGKLLGHYKIKAKLSPYHDHNVAQRVPEIIKSLKSGAKIALISDAGTPLVSDPGFKLARAAIEAGIDVIPLPGASALMAGLVKSGLPSDRFLFAGFLPPKRKARQSVLEDLSSVKATLVFFATGKRIAAVLEDVKTVLGERDAVIARELTKYYEEARRGSLDELLAGIATDPPRGEIVLLLAPPADGPHWDEAQIIGALKSAVPQQGVKRASAEIAKLSGWRQRDVYQLALKL